MNSVSPLIKSILIHLAIVAAVSITFWGKDTNIKVSETPIEVSFVASEKAPEKPAEKEKPKPKEDLPPPLDDKPQPAPKALEKPKPKLKADKADKPQEKKVETPKPKAIVKKPETKPKPKEEPKKPEPEKKAEKDTTTDFASVLKNLQESEPTDSERKGRSLTQSPTVDRMTTGELDAFRMQLSQCWNILPGAAKAETLAVNLTINVNPDRTVRDVQITDTARYQSDPFFRAAADNAIRAIKHPDCTPLDLPVDKYSTWKTITLNFDPGTMF